MTSMNKEIYNSAYKQFTPDYIKSDNISKINIMLKENSQSLEGFIRKYLNQFNLVEKASQASVLEVGCGLGSLSYYLEINFKYFTGIDSSYLAISQANDIARLKHKHLDFRVVDVCLGAETFEKSSLTMKYDFIVDSHLYHCLTSDEERAAYLGFVKNHLAAGGQFIMETMAFYGKIQFPVGFEFSPEYVLKQQIGDEMIPIRSIRKSADIENDFKLAGLEIGYLYYHHELSFNPFEGYPNHPTQFSPKTLRLSAKLN